MKIIVPSNVSAYGTFTRASNGTSVDIAGNVAYAASNVPCYEAGVLLVEASRTNFLLRSGELSNAAWSKTNCTVQSGGQPPDGNNSASSVTRTATGDHVISQTVAMSGHASSPFTFSVWIKGGTLSGDIAIKISDAADAVVGSLTIAPTSTWQRYSVTGVFGASPGATVKVSIDPVISIASPGDVFYAWGAQLESGTARTSYIPTVSSSAARAVASFTPGYIKSTFVSSVSLVQSITDTTDAPAWSAATAYIIGDAVTRASTHHVYTRLVAGTTAATPESDPINWLDNGPTEKYSAVDGSINTAVPSFPEAYFTLKTLGYSGLALIGLKAETVTIKVTDGPGGALLYSFVKSFPATRYDYEDQSTYVSNLVLVDLPSNPGALVHITAGSQQLGVVAVSEIVVGYAADIGKTTMGARVGITDYSRKEADDFGNVTLVERSYARTMSAEVMVELADFQKVYNLLSDIRARPCVYVGSETDIYSPAVIYGWCKDFAIAIQYPQHVVLSLDVEGII